MDRQTPEQFKLIEYVHVPLRHHSFNQPEVHKHCIQPKLVYVSNMLWFIIRPSLGGGGTKYNTKLLITYMNKWLVVIIFYKHVL